MTINIVTGSIAQGKTSFLKRLTEHARQNNISAGGILSLRLIENNTTAGYDVFDIMTGTSVPLCRSGLNDDSLFSFGRFGFFNSGVEYGLRAIEHALSERTRLLIIDEIGMAEVKGHLWNKSLLNVLQNPPEHLFLSVRRDFTDAVVSRFAINEYRIIDVAHTDDGLNDSLFSATSDLII